jgi:hypothetical protein
VSTGPVPGTEPLPPFNYRLASVTAEDPEAYTVMRARHVNLE